MNRRQLLQSTAASSIALFAGCSAFENLEDAAESGTQQSNLDTQSPEDEQSLPEDLNPSVEVLELVQSESQLVSLDNPSTGTFTATIQNTGQSGNIAVALFWQTQESGMEPESVDSLATGAYKREQQKEIFFNSNERRSVEFTSKPPDDAIGYYFLAQPATYGANIRNTGAGGRVTVTMNFKGSILGSDATEEQTVYIDGSSTKEVLFNVTIKPNTEWEIEATSTN